MTNSYRRRPFVGYCGGSQKQDKRIGNRAMRRVNHVLVRGDPDEAVFRTMDEALNPWNMAQDGTRQWQPFSRYRRRTSFWPGPPDERSPEEVYRRWYRWTKAK